MQLIDQHGRLFGRVSLIDVLVVAFLLSLIPMVYVGYRITAGRRDAAVSHGPALGSMDLPVPKWEFINAEALMTINTPETYIQLHPALLGQASEFPAMVVIAMRGYDPKQPVPDPAEPYPDTLVVPEWPKRVVMHFRVPCQYRDGVLMYGGGPLQLGGAFTFTTRAFTISGTVTNLEVARWTAPGP